MRRAARAPQATALDRARRRAAEDRHRKGPAFSLARNSAKVSRHRIRFTLNDAPVEVDVAAERLLLELLREDLGKTGTKDGCSVGVCGLCTVQVDGAPMSACLLLATQVDGAAVRTIEGLTSPLQ